MPFELNYAELYVLLGAHAEMDVQSGAHAVLYVLFGVHAEMDVQSGICAEINLRPPMIFSFQILVALN